MANVHIEVPHRLGATVAQSRLSGFAEDLARVGAKLQWKGTRAEVHGLGVSGEVHAEPTLVRISLKLGLAARVAGVDPARLEKSIRRRLEEALAAGTTDR
jgi:putative polyhydroxyalkanoate system protein